MLRRFSALIALGGLSACAVAPAYQKPSPSAFADMSETTTADLRSVPDVVSVPVPPGSFIVQEPILRLPEHSEKMLTATYADAELDRILYTIASHAQLNLMFLPTARADSAASTNFSASPSAVPGAPAASASAPRMTRISISFSGKTSDFLRALSQASGYFFTFENGTIIVKERETFNVTLPAYPEALREIEANLKTLGATRISYDRLTTSLSFSANSFELQKIKEYLQRARENASLVMLRVILLNVRLNDEKNAGIDWTKLAVGARSQKTVDSFGLRSDSSASSTSSTDSGSSSSSSTQAAVDALASTYRSGVGVLANTTGANLFFEAASFSVSGLLNFIESYGSFQISQNFFLQSMSGTKGKLDILTETPYVSEVSSNALLNPSSTLTQAVKTATAKAGVEMELFPIYNKADGTLSLALKASILGVTRFISLEAGQQIGRITQPETTKKSIDTYLRMTPSQVAIIGGLVFDRATNSAAGLPADSYMTKAYKAEHEREELVVIVKPTVLEFIAAK